jgi:hypothetical protein
VNLEKRRVSLGITTSTGGGGGTITSSTAADRGGDGGGGGMLGIETSVGGRSVGTSNLDDESEPIELKEVGEGSTKDDDVTIDTSSESSVVGGRQFYRKSCCRLIVYLHPRGVRLRKKA